MRLLTRMELRSIEAKETFLSISLVSNMAHHDVGRGLSMLPTLSLETDESLSK